MNLLKIVEKIIAKLKQDPSYSIKIELSNRELFAILSIRGIHNEEDFPDNNLPFAILYCEPFLG